MLNRPDISKYLTTREREQDGGTSEFDCLLHKTKAFYEAAKPVSATKDSSNMQKIISLDPVTPVITKRMQTMIETRARWSIQLMQR